MLRPDDAGNVDFRIYVHRRIQCPSDTDPPDNTPHTHTSIIAPPSPEAPHPSESAPAESDYLIPPKSITLHLLALLDHPLALDGTGTDPHTLSVAPMPAPGVLRARARNFGPGFGPPILLEWTIQTWRAPPFPGAVWVVQMVMDLTG